MLWLRTHLSFAAASSALPAQANIQLKWDVWRHEYLDTGVQTRLVEYGDVGGVRCIVPAMESTCTLTEVFSKLTYHLESMGYVAGSNLHGAPYDWRTAFTPITHIQRVPAVLVVPADSPIKTLADFIAQGKDGKFAVADSGLGTTNHLAVELIAEATGTKYTSVHYKGSGAAMIDVMAGQVPAQVDQLNAAIGNIKSGKLRAIAVSSDKRMPQLPDVPTMKESGVKGLEDFTFATFTGLFGPARMPPDVVAKINEAMVKVLKDPAVIARFAELAAEAYPTTPQETAAMFEAEDRTVVPLIKKLQIKPE